MLRTLVLISFLISSNLMAAAAPATSWAERTLASLTIPQKVAQLFMVSVRQNNPAVLDLVRSHEIGGVIFFKGPLADQTTYLNQLQAASPLGLLVAEDAEWGLTMRHPDDAISYPKNIDLGKLKDPSLLQALGYELGQQCRAMGINFFLGPVVDVNTNPANPVIGKRAYGADPATVIACAQHFITGLHAGGVLSCAKHFPGHGDTGKDSHYELLTVAHDRKHLEDYELAPFRALITNPGVDSIMTAHLLVPALGATDTPATLSKSVMTDLLRTELGFNGLIITDALEMKAISDHYGPVHAALMALQAGCDIVLCPVDPAACIDYVVAAVEHEQLSLKELNTRVLRVLQAKERCWLNKPEHKIINVAAGLAFIQRPEARALKETLEKAIAAD